MEKSLSYQARRVLLQRAVPRYREASPSQKRTLLEAFVATTGYHRILTRGGSSIMQMKYNKHFNAHVLDSMDRRFNTRCSWSGTPPIASVPNALYLFFLPC